MRVLASFLLLSFVPLVALAQVDAGPDATPSPEPWTTATPMATPEVTPEPSATPDASATPEATPVVTPEATPWPTVTPIATPGATPSPAATPSVAEKKEEENAAPRWTESPKWYSAQLGVGGLKLEGEIASEVYGDTYEPAFHGRLGVLLFSILDLGISADFAQITARRIGADTGGESAEISRLTLVPLSAQAVVRLDFFPNQPLVPYAGAGYAYLVWSERNPIEDDQTDGDKQGVVLLGGLQILLDWMEPGRAGDLDGWWGVNDTFLVLEASRSTYGDSDDVEGLDLGHVEGRVAFLFEF